VSLFSSLPVRNVGFSNNNRFSETFLLYVCRVATAENEIVFDCDTEWSSECRLVLVSAMGTLKPTPPTSYLAEALLTLLFIIRFYIASSM
jgi:hypothetical protein